MLLTNNEISDIYEQPSKTPREFARAIEQAVIAKLREQEPSHVLWETGEAGVPSAILDRNGEVVLGLCKICGKGECELVDPCKPHPAPIPEVEAKYNELLMTVSMKFPGETRHETALRYILDRERWSMESSAARSE